MRLNETQKELLSLIQDEEYLKGLNLTKTQLLVYSALYFRDGGYGTMKSLTDGFFTQSNDQLLKLTGIGSKTTLTAALRRLENVGLIDRIPGTINGRIATAYRLIKCTDKKCTDDEKCTSTLNGIDFHNLLKDIKLNKKCTDTPIQKCTNEKQKCTIDIEQDIEKEQYIELLKKENKLLKEELDKVKKELEELKREKNLKNDNMMIVKSNMTLTGETDKVINCPSNEGSKTAKPEEKSSLIPSSEGIEARKAGQQQFQSDFNVFIKTLKNLTEEERIKRLEYFKLRCEKVYTGKYIDINKDRLQKRFDGYTAAMTKNNPSKAKAQEKAQPCNNNGMGVAAAVTSSLPPPVAPVPPSPYEDDFLKEIESIKFEEEKTVTIDELIAKAKSFADIDDFENWDIVPELSGKNFSEDEKDRFFVEFHKVKNYLFQKRYGNKEVA